MIEIAPFDDSAWKQRLQDYRQAVAAQAATKPPLPVVTPHTPYPYERMIFTTRQKSPDKPMLSRVDLPQKPRIAPEIGVYWGIHQIVNVTREIRRKNAQFWSHVWLDPFTYFDEDETPYNDAGGIHIENALKLAKAIFGEQSNVEGEGFSNLYYAALRANEKVIYLAREVETTPANVIKLPLVELSRYPRECAWCGTKTSSGIRALCDQHHHRYIVQGDFRNSPINYDDLARLIIQSDSRHRQNVMEAMALKAAS